MNIWEILQIEKTTNKREIKRAYAKALKHTHPDDDPVAFQKLKEAFDLALKGQDFSVDYETLLYYDKSEQPSLETGEIKLNRTFSEKVLEIYNDFNKRIDGDKWRELFKDDYMTNLDSYIENRIFIANFLTKRGLFVPKEVIEVAFEFYDLDNLIIEKPDDELSFKLYHLKHLPPFSFEGLETLSEENCNLFIRTRYIAYNCSERLGVQSHIKRIKTILVGNPDLELMEIVSGIGNNNQALILRKINAFLEINPQHATARLFRLYLNKQLGHELNLDDLNYAKQDTYFSSIQLNNEGERLLFHIDKNELIGSIYFDLKDYQVAYNYLINAYDTSEKNIRAKITYCLKLKLKEEKKTSKNKKKINEIWTELSFYSLIAYERIHVSNRKMNILKLLFLGCIIANFFSPMVAKEEYKDYKALSGLKGIYRAFENPKELEDKSFFNNKAAFPIDEKTVSEVYSDGENNYFSLDFGSEQVILKNFDKIYEDEYEDETKTYVLGKLKSFKKSSSLYKDLINSDDEILLDKPIAKYYMNVNDFSYTQSRNVVKPEFVSYWISFVIILFLSIICIHLFERKRFWLGYRNENMQKFYTSKKDF
ncbi:DnaJ domain-containing protein [Listeria welshimeri]|uniref:DnaJ domain-containing protein n=1 Tax=Listeria welshimeri TaxID=1643 RepID=UPI0018893813|nr:DnaJ domain-containing protein [Listeria welshimeri]MBF2412222.1 DnaJ domain-containing protein [Listeria welshimeri]MBF2684284.1 DnaJ domain-containing protein [Listeria welshimeri]